MTAGTRAGSIAIDGFAEVLGTRLLAEEPDRVSVLMPYGEHLGIERIHGGAISALVDVAATAAFWSDPSLTETAVAPPWISPSTSCAWRWRKI